MVQIPRPTERLGKTRLREQKLPSNDWGEFVVPSAVENSIRELELTLMNARSRLDAAPSRRWYVAQTHVHAESKAAMHLGRQGFEVYLPRYRKQRRHARRIDVVAAPLFPRYLFVSIELGAQRWRSIQSTIGITRLVGNGDEPSMVSPEIIEGLREREDADGLVLLEQRPRFNPGDQVRISDGAFCDCLGLYEGISGYHRSAILLDLLGRKVRVVLDSQAIEAA